jgi:hypothetical protein
MSRNPAKPPPKQIRVYDYQQDFKLHFTFKAFFIIPTDAHNYKIIGTLKTIKILTIAPTCFGSRRNHNQGTISCLAKTTIMILLCSSTVYHTLAQQAGMLP